MTPFSRGRVLCVWGAALVACGGGLQVAVPERLAPPGEGGNPFADARFFVNPEFTAQVESTAASAPAADGARVRKAGGFATALWLDSIDHAHRASSVLDQALALQRQGGEPVVPVFVLYDLPGRDCSAVASSGELGLGAGEGRYRAEFVDPLAAAFRAHPDERIVAILEPDSLANLATNLDKPGCAAAEQAYRRGIAYAIKTLSLANVSLYLDAAHAGWLGWDANRAKIAHVFREVLDEAGPSARVRGFATDVSNFDPLSDGDGKRPEASNPCPDELTYVAKLSASLAEVGITGKGFIIDTSRNGRRTTSGVWCNVKGAGLGERPRASPEAGIDAYFWVKPPGDSDGASDPASPGYDAACATDASQPGAPHAGSWFAAYFLQLVANANPPL